MSKEIIYIDMDGVLADFGKAKKWHLENNPNLDERLKTNPDLIQGIFKDLEPIDQAIESVFKLHDSGNFELFIATTSPWDNPEAAMHKRLWVEKHFDDLFHKKMFVTHRKDLLIGDYLIDDRLDTNAVDFAGELLSFGWNYKQEKWNPYPTWESVLARLGLEK